MRVCSPGNVCNRTLRKADSSVSGTQESVSQARLEFTGVYSNEIGQLVGEWQQHNFQLFIFANLFFIYFQNSHKITEVVIFFTPFRLNEKGKQQRNPVAYSVIL